MADVPDDRHGREPRLGPPFQLRARVLSVAALALALPSSATARVVSVDDLTELSLEELVQVEVTSVSKRAEPLLSAAAAVYVITSEDIRRSGVTSIPEALRLAPGVEVARVDANTWAIGVRGFGSPLARSVLVLIDGRSVYNPLFAGTYWEVQDTVLADIDQIEVIRGPGGTLWGANAFSGVINIVTKSARQTQGLLVTAGGGTEERAFGTVRYGGRLRQDLHLRAYAKAFARDAGARAPGGQTYDDWEMVQGGVRADWTPGPADTITLQGDLYAGQAGTRVGVAVFDPPSERVLGDKAELLGGNVLGRWTHRFQGGADGNLQLYYDRTDRHDVHYREHRDTFDLDLDHRFVLPWRQELVWGAGYRVTSGRTSAVPTIAFRPADRTDQLFSAFLQDDITVVRDRLHLVLGTKVEHNDYTGVEWQPTARLLWRVTHEQSLWAASSRAVRTPSPTEHDLELNVLVDPATSTFSRILGNRAFSSEVVYAQELGYRIMPHERFRAEVATFYNVYRDLLSLEPGTPFMESDPPPARNVVPVRIGNGLQGRAYGGEVRLDWAATRWLQLFTWYAWLRLDLDPRRGSADTTTEATTEGSSPRHQASARVAVQPWRNLELDATARFVDRLRVRQVDRYVNLDLRVGWFPWQGLEVSVVGQNLLQAQRAEFDARSPLTTRVQRGVYGKLTWQW